MEVPGAVSVDGGTIGSSEGARCWACTAVLCCGWNDTNLGASIHQETSVKTIVIYKKQIVDAIADPLSSY